jgi:hypothetical protein
MLAPDDAVGHMLLASWDYVEGVIARHGDLDDYAMGDWTERFYHWAPDKWRLELSTDLTYISNGLEAVVMAEGRVLHRGRPRIPVDFVAERLLYPGRAPLWAWPGDEGWSLVLAEGRRTDAGMTIPVADAGELVGELHVVLPSGHLDYLRLDKDVSRITELRHRPSQTGVFELPD